MTATAQRKYQVVEYQEEAEEPLEQEDEPLDEGHEPEIGWNTDRDFDTCSPVAAAAPLADPPSRMLLKRSLSPDGRIDSVSVEIELGIDGLSVQEIKTRGLKALQLEAEIAQGHLVSPSPLALPPTRANAQTKTQNGFAKGNGQAAYARLIDIGRTRNNCYFINVEIGSKTAKLFGSRQQLVTQLAKAGQMLTPEAISDGLRLNFFCRAITEPSNDGRYLNVVELLPDK